MNKNILMYRRIALTGYAGLLLWMPLWYFWLSPSELSSGFVIAVLIAPLFFPMKGLIQGNPYTYAWTNFIVMIYFMHGLASLLTDPDEILYAVIELIFALMLFIGCVYYARLTGREKGLKLQKLSEVLKQEKAAFEGTEQPSDKN